MTKPSAETLNAYVDGELDDAERRLVEAHLEHDAEARAFVDMLCRVNSLASGAMAELVPPAPPALIARINSIPAGPAPKRSTNPSPYPPPYARRPVTPYYAMAASVALLAAGAMAYVFMGNSTRDGLSLAKGALPPGSAIAELLERGNSGQTTPLPAHGPATGQATLAATFQDRAGRYCRELEVSVAETPASASIACRSREGMWAIEGSVALAGSSPDVPSGYVPSGSESDEPLATLMRSLGLGGAFPTSEEEALISRGWRDQQVP